MPFTAVNENTSWQELAIAAEICAAYNKRVVACGGSPVDPPDEDTTVFYFILQMQEGIESLATRFADPTVDVSVSGSALPVTFADKDELLAAAGLTQPGGWRRIPEGEEQPEWSYGTIEDKDLAGPWLFEDIQSVLEKMTRLIMAPEAQESYYTNDMEVFAPDGDPPLPVTGNVPFTQSTSTSPYRNYALVKCAKTGWGSVLPAVHMAQFPLNVGEPVENTERTACLIFIARNDEAEGDDNTFSAATGVTAIGMTEIRDLTVENQSIITEWIFKSPADLLEWATVCGAVDGSGIGPEEVRREGIRVSWDDVCAVIDYAFEDGAE